MKHLQQPSHKIFDFLAYIDWLQGIKCSEMAVFDRQNQYQGADALQMRQPFCFAEQGWEWSEHQTVPAGIVQTYRAGAITVPLG